MNRFLKSSALFILSTIIVSSVNGQKLPNKQEASVRAPAGIKVYNKSAVWDKFQAYNHATDIFYTIENDDDNLYLMVQVTRQEIINKIMGGGVTLSINKYNVKKDKRAVWITYPVIAKEAPRFIVDNDWGDLSAKDVAARIAGFNKTLDQKCKWIGVQGIKNEEDMISVYNDSGIKAVGLFDNKKRYNLELVVSLKQLGLSAEEASKLTYHIVVNGRPFTDLFAERTIDGKEPPPMMTKIRERMARMSVPTDFWGEYTLAKNSN